MFINSLLKFIGGQIEVLVSGGNIERFLNLLNNAQIKIWDIKRKDIGSITFHMYKRNFKHIRYAVRKTGVKYIYSTNPECRLPPINTAKDMGL